MRKAVLVLIGLLYFLLVPASTTFSETKNGSVTAGAQMKGHVLVKFSSATGRVPLAQPELGADLGIARLEPLFPTATRTPLSVEYVTAPDGRVVPKPDLSRWHRAVLQDENTDINAVVESLKKIPGIAHAEPDYLRRPTGEMTRSPMGSMPDGIPLPGSGSDPLFDKQWHLAAARVPEAWAYLKSRGLPPGGSRDVIVAVIDTGVDYNHPDLAANMWVNGREVKGNGLDDDSNGYADDLHGVNVITGSGNPMDDHGHGTHVAGIIAAQAGNVLGGAGVAYNVQIMAIKAAQYSGVLATSDIARGIYYAVAHGADVINMSFGGYNRSQIEEDALTVAFGQAVLVAAAGNDGVPNERACDPLRARAMFPASYNWVVGVMARAQHPGGNGDHLARFSNYDCTPRNTTEYELMAPGLDIMSTLPGGQYAAWDGTSMAAPVVSGIAALVRTLFPDKDTWSSRFIMGQIATTGASLQAYTPDRGEPVFFRDADALAALTAVPKPSLSYLEHWLFDTPAQSPLNDNDGVVDAGETIDLAVVIRNHWGKADDVHVTLRPWNGVSATNDPFVTMLNDTVHYGAVGSFNADDNGLLYDAQGVITGVRNPFRFSVSPETPNGHVIPFVVTMSARNGFDPADGATYTSTSGFSFTVQRGRELPRIISQDMVLTKDSLWLVPDATLIEAGVTVTVKEGARVQFWSSKPNDPYHTNPKAYLQVEGKLIVEGTENKPVELFPSALYPDHRVLIRSVGMGETFLKYAKVRNPLITGGKLVEHCYFDQSADSFSDNIDRFLAGNTMSTKVEASLIENSIFRKLGGNFNGMYSGHSLVDYGFSTGTSMVKNSLFDSTFAELYYYFQHGSPAMKNNVFLKNYKVARNQWGNETVVVSVLGAVGNAISGPLNANSIFPVKREGNTYFVVPGGLGFDLAELIARQFDGHIVTINDEMENLFLVNYRKQFFNETIFRQTYPNMYCGDNPCWSWYSYEGSGFSIGLTDRDEEGVFKWISGELLNYTNWSPNQPDNGNVNQDYVQMVDQWEDVDFPASPFVLEVPGEWTQSQIDAKIYEYLFGEFWSNFSNNAILNEWWRLRSDRWMKFYADDAYGSNKNRNILHSIGNNYWGGAPPSLIDVAIIDYNDDFDRGRYIYEPILTTAPETAYPFVVDVAVSNRDGQRVSQVGNEPVTFTVTFNRDMDTTLDPQVSFGPDTPLTDYTVHKLRGGWQDPRVWTGTFNINPVTGDGYQLIRVAGARAADDRWLVTGDDSGRFRFEIITSGTEAMNLQANGGEGYVDLTWSQDDFDLLAGYNLYRSTAPGGVYSRINASIIPPAMKSFRDTAVQPGQPYYYKFTVSKTDMTESVFSNVASAAPLDTVPPVIAHVPLTSASPGISLVITALVTDNVAVTGVTLHYRKAGTQTYGSATMVKTTGSSYSATIAGSLLGYPGLEYYIEATDGISVVRSARIEQPHWIDIEDRPVVTAVTPGRGPSSGGTAITVAGSNFKAGAKVSLGGGACGGVVVISGSQISCTTPAHFPAIVDVTVTGADGRSGVLLRGFVYESDTASVSLPSLTGGQHAILQIPINAAGIQGLAAADLTITYDSAVLKARGVKTGSLTSGWSLSANIAVSGQIRLGVAGPGGTVSGSGVLALLEFEVIGAAGQNSQLRIAAISLNDGAIPVQTAEATFGVEQVYSVSGKIQYWKAAEAVPGAKLTFRGDKLHTGDSAADGFYAVAGITAGSYTLGAEKTGDAKGISAYDASLVLQHAVGLITLDGGAAVAADVNRSGSINSMDAFYILQKAVELIELPFPGAGVVWDFIPASRTLTNLNQNLTGQDFTAVLLGDVSGNWDRAEASGLQGGEGVNPAILYLREGLPSADGSRNVNLSIDPGGHAVYSLDMLLWFEPGQMTVRSVDVAAAGGWNYSVNIGLDGRVRLALARATALTEPGGLLTLHFYPAAGPPREIAFEALAWQINENNVPARYEKVSIAVPQAGDLNGDGAVTIGDAILALRIVAGMPGTPAPGALVSDANRDHRSGVADAIFILQRLSGLRD